MRKISTLLLIALFLPALIFAQHTITNDWNSFEISGYIIAFYQYRPHFPGDPKGSDHKDNTFDLDDARLNLKGYVKGHFKYELEANFATLAEIAIEGISAIKDDPLTEMNIQYINNIINVKAGYFKLPTSASSFIDKVPSPFLQRAPIADGDYYSRRDAGILLFKDLWHQRINLIGGIVSGMGEQIILGKGDPDGKPEYLGRIQLSSSYYRDEEIDYKDLALPLARVAGNIRYADQTVWSGDGTGVSTFATDNDLTVNGKKLTYGMDAGFMWHGFSAQFEMDRARITPNSDDPEAATLKLYNTNYLINGGFLVQANYYNKLLQSVFAVRYNEFNPSDLVAGDQERTMTFAYNFVMRPYNLTIKLHYDYRFKQPDINQKWTEDQLRAGIQYTF